MSARPLLVGWHAWHNDYKVGGLQRSYRSTCFQLLDYWPYGRYVERDAQRGLTLRGERDAKRVYCQIEHRDI